MWNHLSKNWTRCRRAHWKNIYRTNLFHLTEVAASDKVLCYVLGNCRKNVVLVVYSFIDNDNYLKNVKHIRVTSVKAFSLKIMRRGWYLSTCNADYVPMSKALNCCNLKDVWGSLCHIRTQGPVSSILFKYTATGHCALWVWPNSTQHGNWFHSFMYTWKCLI